VRIALLTPGGLEYDYLGAICPPLGLLYLVSYCRKYFSDMVEFTVTTGENMEQLLNEPPDIMGISSVTEGFPAAVALAGTIRRSLGAEFPIILGGPHITAIPESLSADFTLGVIGEGEVTFTELIRLYDKAGRFRETELRDIPGLAYHSSNGKIRLTEPRPPVGDLDLIPPPDRKLAGGSLITHLITSRGCRFRCYFCSAPTLWRTCRTHSPAYVVEELIQSYEALRNRLVIFFDDLFIADRERILDIAALLAGKGLDQAFDFFGYGRTEFIDGPMVTALKKLNMTEVSLGTQSGLSLGAHRRFREDEHLHQRAIDLCHQNGIQISCSFIIGAPFETEDDLAELCRFLERNRKKLYSIQISPLRIFPGTSLWEYAGKRGLTEEFVKDWTRVTSFTLFEDFDPDDYLYLNEVMDFSVFKKYCAELKAILGSGSKEKNQLL